MKIFVATGAFMVAMVAAMLFSAIRYRRISPLLWFSGVMVVILGGLTIWLHNESFIKMKPTIYYALVSGLLWFGLATDRPLLQRVLGSTYPGLDEDGWTKLTRNWAIFFAFMAVPQRSRVAQQLRPTSGSASSCGARSPSPSCSPRPTSRCCCKHGLMKDDADAGRTGADRMSDPILSIRGLRKDIWHRRRGAEVGRPRHPPRRDFRAARAQWRRQDDADQHRLRDRHADRRRSAGRRQELAERLPPRPRAASAWSRRS